MSIFATTTFLFSFIPTLKVKDIAKIERCQKPFKA